MTALDRYERLEAVGIWRDRDDDPGREVVVKFGKSTLVLEARADEPLTHWSLPALRVRARAGSEITYAPDGESIETLTIADDEMHAALARVIAPPTAPPPSDRKPMSIVRTLIVLGGLLVLGIAMLPMLLGWVAPSLIAPERARLLAATMIPLIEERTGPTCASPGGAAALDRLGRRLSGTAPPDLKVMDLGDIPFLALPGETVLISRHLAERAETPEEFAGWAALGLQMSKEHTAIRHVFQAAGLRDGFTFLLSGTVTEDTVDGAVNRLLIEGDVRKPLPVPATTELLANAAIPVEPLLAGIRREALSGSPLTIPPSEGGDGGPIVLTGIDWRAIQSICGG